MIDIKNKQIHKHKANISIIQLCISKAGLYELVGLNGSGKTTLLKYIYESTASEHISYLPQEIVLLENLSINENINALTASPATDERLIKYLIPLNRDIAVKHLSGGQKRKLQLYIALSSPANILFIDEPFNHIDQKTIAFLVEYLEVLSADKIIVYVDHYHLLSTPVKVSVSEPIEIVSLGSCKDIGDSHKLSFCNQFKNLKIITKITYVLAMLVILLSTFFISSRNNLDNYSYEFISPQIAAEVAENSCNGAAQNVTGINSSLYDIDIPTKLKIGQRNPLSRNYVYYKRDFTFGASPLTRPKEEVSDFNGPLNFLDIHNVVVGEIPNDDSNQVMIPYFYGQQLVEERAYSNLSDLIGEPLLVGNYETEISGVYRDVNETEKGTNILFAYDSDIKATCNPILERQSYVSNSRKVAKIVMISGFIVLVVIVITYGLEWSYFNNLRFALIKNKILYSYLIISIVSIITSIIYYFNYP